MVRITGFCLAVVAVVGCAKSGSRIVVGSKNFTEQLLLGEIIAQQIERETKLPVERKLNLGGTLLAHQALTSGAIDLYPEYTGTALTAILKLNREGDANRVFERVRGEYERKWRLQWLPPFGFNNTFAMTVRGEDARAERLKTLSDAARRAKPWRMGVGYEFLQRPDGYDGLVRTYGLRVEGSPVSMDLGLLYQALLAGQVEMIAANATDGQLSRLDVKVLEDDRGYFPPYECAVILRQAVLDAHPELRGALEKLSGKISDETMRRLNYLVEGERRPIPQVATEFLSSVGR